MQNTTNWPAVVAVLAAGVVGAAYVGKMPAALPQFQTDLGLSLVEVSWLVSIFNLLGLAAAILFGFAADRVGAFRFCVAGLLACAAGGALGSQAQSPAGLLASRVIEGAGFIALTVSAPVLLAVASAPRDRNLTLGLWGGYLPAGASATLAVSPLALATIGWRGLWLAIALLTLGAAVWLASRASGYAGATAGRRRSLADAKQALARLVPWLFGAAFSLYTLAFTAVMVWLPTYAQQTQSASITHGALLAAAFVAANLGGNLYGTRLAHRDVARGRTIMTAFAIGAVAAVGIFSPQIARAASYACAMVFSFVIGVIPPAVMSGVPRYARTPAEAGTLQGLIVQLSNLGIFMAPPLVAAAVSAAGDWQAALFVLDGAAAAGFVLGILITRSERLHASLPRPER